MPRTLPEAERKRGTVVKRLFILSALLSVSELSGTVSYAVRELLASLALFIVASFFLALVALGALLVWGATKQVAIWTRPLSRNVIAFSRRLITPYARP